MKLFIFTYSVVKIFNSIENIDEINPNKFNIKTERLVDISMNGYSHFEDHIY